MINKNDTGRNGHASQKAMPNTLKIPSQNTA